MASSHAFFLVTLALLGFVAAQVTDNLDCALIVPENALTADGLATPWQLIAADPSKGECHMNNTRQQAFVQGTILDLDTGDISVYNPLVIDAGTQPAIAPVTPQLPQNFVIGLWIGFNGKSLVLQNSPNSTSADDAGCISGLVDPTNNQTDLFGQFVFCNASYFFSQAIILVNSGLLVIPPLGIGNDGFACPSVRDFGIVDQYAVGGVSTTYLWTSTGTLAQNTASNRNQFSDALIINNTISSDAIVLKALDTALNCTLWLAPDLADSGSVIGAFALNELVAIYWQQQPMALVMANDTLVVSQTDGKPNLDKLNAFRQGVGQPTVPSLDNATSLLFCQALSTVAPARLQSWSRFDATVDSPDPDVASNLVGYLAARFVVAWGALNCTDFTDMGSPIAVIINEKGIAIGEYIWLQNNTIPSSAFESGGQFFSPPRNVTL